MATNETPRARTPWSAVYTHNPFYLISALCVLYGLRLSFESPITLRSSCVLAGSLALYAAILALVGWIIVRYGRVWDDARTILLAVILVLLAMGNSFDLVAIRFPTAGRNILLLSCGYALLLSEVLLAALRIRLPIRMRAPCYLVLALIYLYPIHVARVVDEAHTWPPVAHAMLAFSPLSALAILSFWPAARLPRDRYARCGVPWQWPWFPWTLPVVLLCGIGGRSYMLSMSFAPVQGNAATFQPYFLVWPLLAALIVAVELARTSGWRRFERVALLAPCALVLLPLMRTHAGTSDRFLLVITEQIGTPLFLTLGSIVLFYGYQWLRGSRLAECGCYVGLLALSVSAPHSVQLPDWVGTAWAPLAVASLAAGYGALRWRTPVRCALAAGLALATLGSANTGTWLLDYQGFVLRHLALVAMLLIGGFGRDRFAVAMRCLAAIMLAVTCVASTIAPAMFVPPMVAAWLPAYQICLVLLAWWIAFQFASYLLLIVAVAGLAGTLAAAATPLLLALRRDLLRDGFEPLVGGLACLALAVLISLTKAGCRLRVRWSTRPWSAI